MVKNKVLWLCCVVPDDVDSVTGIRFTNGTVTVMNRRWSDNMTDETSPEYIEMVSRFHLAVRGSTPGQLKSVS